MNTRQYNYLLTIAECGYLSRASEKIGISQAALSKFLDEQERLLGVELFVRYKKKLYPTSAGNLYLEAAQQILNVKNRTLHTISRLTDSSVRSIRVAFTPYRGSELFSRVYARFSNAFSSVDLLLEDTFSSRQEEKVHLGQVDFAFGVNCHANYPDVCNLAVCREELVLAVPSFHPLAKYANPDTQHLVSMPIRAFWDTPFVLPGHKNNIRIVAENLFAKAGFSPVVAFESDNGMTVDSMIRQGAGIGLVSRRYVKRERDLVYFRLDPLCFEIIYLRYSTNRTLSDMDRYLCGLMVQERMKSRHHTLIPSPEVDSFLNSLPNIHSEE